MKWEGNTWQNRSQKRGNNDWRLVLLSTKPTGGNNTKTITHNHRNQLTCAHTYGTAHPDCTDSYCRTWSEHRHTCSHFSLYQALTGRPWTINLHRWAEKSLVQVNTGIRLREGLREEKSSSRKDEDTYFTCAFYFGFHSVFPCILQFLSLLK